MHLGPCPVCDSPVTVPGFSTTAVTPRCETCAREILVEVRDALRDAYAGAGERDLALALSASVGQAIAALLGGERAASRAFLANAVVLGEMLLAAPPEGV